MAVAQPLRRLPRLSVFASGWSASFLQAPPHQRNPKSLAPPPPPVASLRVLETLVDEAARTGFNGLEMSLSDLGQCRAERSEAAELIGSRGLRLICGLYSGWDDYEGGWPGFTTPAQHLRQFEQQLQQIEDLGPVVQHVNVHSGCDSWAASEAEEYVAGALAITAASSLAGRGFGLSHETHRGRVFHHPHHTARLLDRFPDLRLTADLSHWHVVTERTVGYPRADCPSETTLLETVVARRVDHIHARVGTTQTPQVAPQFWQRSGGVSLAEPHEQFWKAVWTAATEAGATEVTATPEYGPTPYQTTGGDSALWPQTLDAAAHLRATFAAWQLEQV